LTAGRSQPEWRAVTGFNTASESLAKTHKSEDEWASEAQNPASE